MYYDTFFFLTKKKRKINSSGGEGQWCCKYSKMQATKQFSAGFTCHGNPAFSLFSSISSILCARVASYLDYIRDTHHQARGTIHVTHVFLASKPLALISGGFTIVVEGEQHLGFFLLQDRFRFTALILVFAWYEYPVVAQLFFLLWEAPVMRLQIWVACGSRFSPEINGDTTFYPFRLFVFLLLSVLLSMLI
ncbi:uncharacterized protein TEOVI_000136700 [Trypanosoma equiperdum]|uniref:T. brucei spp.-specific protein n=2 Tax=Trypanozoon TaxID=39700 RepID=Q381Q9_TRYB2|nr:hypothetical protein Tb11.01.6910 [Trypanosoma brucei brucei TREU927]EAN80472.1 hypothetical protein Tb11.01.6910 [Trypanosoma brucei brucei TREU927]SCU69798.1 hypothetical protein, conserved [Trypanosoma equiperdum]